MCRVCKSLRGQIPNHHFAVFSCNKTHFTLSEHFKFVHTTCNVAQSTNTRFYTTAAYSELCDPVCGETSTYEHYHTYVSYIIIVPLLINSEEDTCYRNRLIRPRKGDFILTSTITAVLASVTAINRQTKSHSGIDRSFLVRCL